MMFWCWRECWDEDQWQGKAGRIIFGIVGGAILTLFLLSLGLSAPIAVAPPFVSPDESKLVRPPQSEPVRATVRPQGFYIDITDPIAVRRRAKHARAEEVYQRRTHPEE